MARQPLPLHRLSSDSRRRARRSDRRRRARGCDRLDAARRRGSTPCACPASRGRPRSTSASRCWPAHPDAVVVAGGSDLGVECEPARHAVAARREPRSASTSCASSPRRRRRSGSAPRCRSPTSSAGGSTRRRSFAEWLRALRVAADPQPRDARRQSGHRLAHRRRGAAAPGARRGRCTSPAATAAARSPLADLLHRLPRAPRSSPARSLTAIEIPKPFPQHVRFYKVAKRRLDDISTVAAAMALDRDAGGRVRRARFAFGGVAATPRARDRGRRRAPNGQPWNAATVERVQRALERTLAPHQRRARLGGLPPAGGLQPGREVLSRSRGHERPSGRPVPHESARGHVTGAALYTDDLARALSRTCCTRGRCWRRTRTRA